MTTTDPVETILATDCGSTTTKAILIEHTADGYRLVGRGEAPTTVEVPDEDVAIGLRNAIRNLEGAIGRKLFHADGGLTPSRGPTGCDVFVSTSSAGGGLRMLVAGAVHTMTAQSAARAALGAGAIVTARLATNDGLTPIQRIERLRCEQPDMVLLAGGTDGGTARHPVELAHLIAAARLRPRFDDARKLPVIYAGNARVANEIRDILAAHADLQVVDNLRPTLEREHLEPARDAIHDLFLSHVMAAAPGYQQLIDLTTAPLMPTPAAVGRMLLHHARQTGHSLLAVDIGGATTDIFSVLHADDCAEPDFQRTVSANLGMSYSIANVLAEAGDENVFRWLPQAGNPRDLHNRVANKMLYPTTIPGTIDDLLIEHALCREALRLALDQHRSMTSGLRGRRRDTTLADPFHNARRNPDPLNLMRIQTLIGSGGILSHAPRRSQAALLLIDGFQPLGVTQLAVDAIFMLPHLGVLSTAAPQAASEVFARDCLIPLGTCIAPLGNAKPGKPCLNITIERGAGSSTHTEEHTLNFGELKRIPLDAGRRATITLRPHKRLDLGAGPGREYSCNVTGGHVGIIIDTRGRPIQLPANPSRRAQTLRRWWQAVDAYPRSM